MSPLVIESLRSLGAAPVVPPPPTPVLADGPCFRPRFGLNYTTPGGRRRGRRVPPLERVMIRRESGRSEAPGPPLCYKSGIQAGGKLMKRRLGTPFAVLTILAASSGQAAAVSMEQAMAQCREQYSPQVR